MFLCLKNGDKDHTSVSFNVRVVAREKIGSTKENVHQVQSVTSSSGQESVTDGI